MAGLLSYWQRQTRNSSSVIVTISVAYYYRKPVLPVTVASGGRRQKNQYRVKHYEDNSAVQKLRKSFQVISVTRQQKGSIPVLSL